MNYLSILAIAFMSLYAQLANSSETRTCLVMDDNGWLAQPAKSLAENPQPAAWGTASITGPYSDLAYEKSAQNKPDKDELENYKRFWKQKVVRIPQDWQGKRIRFEIPPPMRQVDVILFVNGRKAGEILRPGGGLDISTFVDPGKENEFRLFLTNPGTETSRGAPAYDKYGNRAIGLDVLPQLVATAPDYIVDVFANTSFQKKLLTLEVEVNAEAETQRVLHAQIQDQNGSIVKEVRETVHLTKGENQLRFPVPWTNPACWELGAPYLYTCKVELVDQSGVAGDVYPSFTFGFREVWRDGKELYMNGHPLHLRPCYSFSANKYGAEFLRKIGYNCLTCNHDWNPYPIITEDYVKPFDEMGMGLFICNGNSGAIGDKIQADTPERKEYRDFVRLFSRRFRNHPSVLACYVTMMTICPVDNMRPEILGQVPGKTIQDNNIEKAREIGREFNPNVLYYSHADGSNGDMSSCNLYLNWTPLQEREEWLSQWATKGLYPWHGAEFGQPYNGCFWRGKIFIPTEHFTQYFGDRAYREEPAAGLANTLGMGIDNVTGHGSKNRHLSLDKDYPLFWEMRRLWTWLTNRSWRTFGMNGGNVYFNLDEAYGTPPGEGGFQRYAHLPASITGKPDWANEAFDIHQLGNMDFCGYIGGYPQHTDKTHAYYAGSDIDKQAVFIWDGTAKTEFSAVWQANLVDGALIASGTVSKTMKTGEILLEKISFRAPEVTRKTPCRLTMKFTENGKEIFSDTFLMEVYPRLSSQMVKATTTRKTRKPIAIFDPSGKDIEILRTLGLPYREIKKMADVNDADCLVIGKNALKSADFDFSVEHLGDGLRVLILPQLPETWQALGFKVIDPMARMVFLRDKKNPALAELTDDVLRYWAGAPDYGSPFGPVMSHASQRGPRWTRNHTVAGLMLQIPERAGFSPLIDGEFDMNYAALMRFEYRQGSITYCTLDLEDRVGVDPAATLTAWAVFQDVLTHPDGAQARFIFVDDTKERNLVQTLGFSTVDAPNKAELIVAGKDARITWPELRRCAKRGKNVLIINNSSLAKAAGFTMSRADIYRAAVPDLPVFNGIGPGLLRWRDVLNADLLQTAPDGFTIAADGLIGQGKIGSGNVVFSQIDPEQLSSRYKTTPELGTLVDAAAQTSRQFYEDLLRVLGAPEKEVKTKEHFRRISASDWWDSGAKDIIQKLNLNTEGKSGTLLIVGNAEQQTWRNLIKQAEAGANILIVGNDKIAKEAGFRLQPRQSFSFAPVQSGLLAQTCIAKLCWPINAPVNALQSAPEGFVIQADGLIAEGKIGDGLIVFCQFSPFELQERYATFPDRQKGVELSIQRVLQLYARLLTNLGGQPGELLAQRALYLAGIAEYSPLKAMHVLGPFSLGKDDGALMLQTRFSGEEMAIAGDFNPNIKLKLPQGGEADWRLMITPDAGGLADLGKLFPAESFPVSYAICHFERKNAGSALLKFGVDWRAIIWCNGEKVFHTEDGALYPKFEIKLDLKQGDNYLAFKIGGGKSGNKFWGLLSNELSANAAQRKTNHALEGVLLYEPLLTGWDPYTYVYW